MKIQTLNSYSFKGVYQIDRAKLSEQRQMERRTGELCEESKIEEKLARDLFGAEAPQAELMRKLEKQDIHIGLFYKPDNIMKLFSKSGDTIEMRLFLRNRFGDIFWVKSDGKYIKTEIGAAKAPANEAKLRRFFEEINELFSEKTKVTVKQEKKHFQAEFILGEATY
ncbi:MAG: hypothetical protein LBK53_05720 [Heliobacteriaceae bacterium]|jgi:hypothetical protein|nr:hypothetical protein [Heliobacteriaceae bacterium]